MLFAVVDGTWTDWAEWSICIGGTNCRDYQRSRCRFCNAPRCGGADCVGESIESEPCNSSPCEYACFH